MNGATIKPQCSKSPANTCRKSEQCRPDIELAERPKIDIVMQKKDPIQKASVIT
jgi:hypothetical protein